MYKIIYIFLKDHITVIAFIANVQDQISYIVVTSDSFLKN